MGDDPHEITRLVRAKELFLAARELSLAERDGFIADQCGDDAALGQLVRDLLRGEDLPLPFESLADGIRAAQHEDPTLSPPALTVRSSLAHDRIGNYKLLERIGEGGFGVVFMAEQERPVRRRVALKIIKLGMDTRQVVARFEAERQALAMMDHPCIAKVFDAGATETGRPYFVMELVRGLPITEYCDARRLSIPARLELFVQVCDALQHAHQKGVIHRDIKPSNVLVTELGETSVPKVIDFGIAKATNIRLTEKTLFTEHRQMIGTPEYMSPEQASTSGIDADSRSDVYSLGVLLYELLAGATPFDSERLRSAAFGEIQRIIREEDPPRPSTRLSKLKTIATVAQVRGTEPSRLGLALRGELDWVVMRCLEKDRARRYDSAGSLMRDVRRYLAGEAVTAVPPTTAYRLRKMVRRNRGPVAAGALLAFALVAGLIGTSLGYFNAEAQREVAEQETTRAEREKERADREAQEARQQRERAERESYIANLRAANLSVQGGEHVDAKERLMRCPEDRRGWEWKYISNQLDTSLRYYPDTQTEGMTGADLDVSPDGTAFVTPLMDRKTGASGARIAEINSAAERVRCVSSEHSEVQTARFSPDGTRILTAAKDGTVRVFDATTGVETKVLDRGSTWAMYANWFADGKRVVAVFLDGSLRIINTETLETSELPDLPNGILRYSADVLPGTELILLTQGISPPLLWDLHHGPSKIGTYDEQSRRALPSPDGRLVASAAMRSIVRLIDATSGQLRASLSGHTQLITAMAFSADGARLATGSEDGTLRVWDTGTGEQVNLFLGHRGHIFGVRFTPDGARVISNGTSGMRVWSTSASERGECIDTPAHPGLGSAVYSPSVPVLVTCDESGKDGGVGVRLRDARTLRLIRQIDEATSGRARFSADGTRLVTAAHRVAGGTVRIWDTTSWALLHESDLFPSPAPGLAVNGDGSRIAATFWDFPPVLMNGDGAVIRHLDEGATSSPAITFSPNGREVIGFGADGVPWRWDALTGASLGATEIPGGARTIESYPGYLLLAFEAGYAGLWTWPEQKLVHEFRGHGAALRGAAFLPDMSRVVTIGRDGTVRLWDPKTGDEVAVLRTVRPTPEQLAIDPSGDGILVKFEDRDAQILRVSPVRERLQSLEK